VFNCVERTQDFYINSEWLGEIYWVHVYADGTMDGWKLDYLRVYDVGLGNCYRSDAYVFLAGASHDAVTWSPC